MSKKRLTAGFLLMATLAVMPVFAEEAAHPIQLIPLDPSTPAEPIGPQPTFRVNASMNKMLPQEMYGTWSVTSRYVDGDVPPGVVVDLVHLIWTLETSGGEVILTNPTTTAETQVHVDEVKNKTATFHHIAHSESGRRRVVEHITLTVNEDTIYGHEKVEYIYLHNGAPSKVFYMNLNLEGKRLAGSKVTFHPLDRPENYFEIEPLRHE